MNNRLHGAILDAGAALNTFVNRNGDRLPLLQGIDAGRTDLHAGAVAVTFVIVHRDRYFIAFPRSVVHYLLLRVEFVAMARGYLSDHPAGRIPGTTMAAFLRVRPDWFIS